jgi:molybdopterin biosynthesis enzyme
MAEVSEIQRIAKLTPLADVLASFDLSVGPVEPRSEAVAQAVGLTLAVDAVIPEGHPKQALALRDGYAVSSDATNDASAFAPAPLWPAAQRVEVGDPLPLSANAVAPLDAVQVRGEHAEALSPVAPGDGVLAAGVDAPPGHKLLLSGARLRRIDSALLAAAGVSRVIVRQPRVQVVRASPGTVVDATATLIANAINAESALALTSATSLETALKDSTANSVVVIGGTGSGLRDQSVRALAQLGSVAFHGIGIMPGETTALGFVGPRPVLILPGRMDGALAGWLTVGRRMLARLAFRLIEEQPFAAELARKISSPLGLAEVVPVRRRLGKVEPLGSGYLPIQTLARAEGWILVPADSEGHAAGSRVVVRPWP